MEANDIRERLEKLSSAPTPQPENTPALEKLLAVKRAALADCIRQRDEFYAGWQQALGAEVVLRAMIAELEMLVKG